MADSLCIRIPANVWQDLLPRPALKHNNTSNSEVHIADFASNYQGVTLSVGTPLEAYGDPTHFSLSMIDYDSDGLPDLVAVKTNGVPYVEIHALSGYTNFQQWLTHVSTAWPAVSDNSVRYVMADVDKDGIPDLVCIPDRPNGSSISVEVHVLSGAGNYQDFIVHAGTPYAPSFQETVTYSMADYNGDGILDLFATVQENDDAGDVTIHVLDGSNNFQSFLLNAATPFTGAYQNTSFTVRDFDYDGVPDVVGI